MNTSISIRHERTDECDGMPVTVLVGLFSDNPELRSVRCRECRVELCSCERAYGHDCEEGT